MPLRRVRGLLASLAVVSATACSSIPGGPGAESPAAERAPLSSEVSLPDRDTVVLTGGTAEQLALQTTQVLYDKAPVVVSAPAGDVDVVDRAASAAIALGAPLLLSSAAELEAELKRLSATAVLGFGDVTGLADRLGSQVDVVPAPAGDAAVADLADRAFAAAGRGDEQPRDGLPQLARAQPLDELVVLASLTPETTAAAATARAAGARVVTVDGGDPRADSGAVSALSGQPVGHVLALGAAFGDPERLRVRVETAASGRQLPGGGQVLLPNRRLVALYGHPGSTTLGVLGRQRPADSVRRAQRLAADYQPYSEEPVIPAFEIIATVASANAGRDGNYSAEAGIGKLRPYVEAATAAGMYVVLDLQPGRSDFLTQARMYEELLALPNVGLALDPEWRLGPNQRHLRQVGHVRAAEVNKVAEWLARLVRDRRLPQKLLLLHQFQPSMIRQRPTVDTSHDELAVVFQMDGHGSRGEKLATWQRILKSPPEGARFAWKNFYRRDTPLFTPKETLALQPTPWFVSYQ